MPQLPTENSQSCRCGIKIVGLTNGAFEACVAIGDISCANL